jgi:hypothetical protein
MTLVNKDVWVTVRNRDVHSGYKFSTSDKNHSFVKALKQNAKQYNDRRKELSQQYNDINADPIRVRLMPRGPRVGPSLKDFGTRRSYDTYLPMKYATHYDVYVYDPRDGYAFKTYSRGFNDGMTRAKQEMITKLDNTIDALTGVIDDSRDSV